MRTRSVALLSSALFALVSIAAASALAQGAQQTQTFRVRYPSDWEVRIHGSTLELTDPEGSISFELRTVTQASQFAAAREQYERELSARATDLTWDGPARPVQQHGFAGFVRRGTGVFNGRRMAFFMLALANASGGVVGAGVILHGAPQPQVQETVQVLDSIEPAVR